LKGSGYLYGIGVTFFTTVIIYCLLIVFEKWNLQLERKISTLKAIEQFEIYDSLFQVHKSPEKVFNFDSNFTSRIENWGFLKVGIKTHLNNNQINLLLNSHNTFNSLQTFHLRNSFSGLDVQGTCSLSGNWHLQTPMINLNKEPKKVFYGQYNVNRIFEIPDLEKPNETFVSDVINKIQVNCKRSRSSPLAPSIFTSFIEKEKYIFWDNSEAKNFNLIGKIILFNPDSLIVKSNDFLLDVILISPIIKLNKGFKGRVQALASSRIELEEKVQLYKPSALVCDGQLSSSITISKNCSIKGLIFCDSQSKNAKIFFENTSFEGVLFSPNASCYLFESNLSGHIWLKELSDNNWNRINHLKNSNINECKKHLHPFIFKESKNSKYEVLERLN